MLNQGGQALHMMSRLAQAGLVRLRQIGHILHNLDCRRG
jgi:hypothetical protein